MYSYLCCPLLCVFSLLTAPSPAESPCFTFLQSPPSPSFASPFFATLSPHIHFPHSLPTPYISLPYLPFTILSPPVSINISALTRFSSPHLICHASFYLFFITSVSFFTLTPSHAVCSPPVSFPPRHLTGGLAFEHHHHGQLHEQVQPSVLVRAAAQTHGVEPPRGLVPPQEDR